MTTPTDTRIEPRDRSPNEQVHDAIVQLMELSPHHELRQIHIDISDQQILLTGIAPSYFIKQMAQETARQACPVRKMHNRIKVTQ